MVLETSGFVVAFSTIVGTLLLAELTDKDALLLLTLATRMRPLLVFAAGAVAFTTTSAIIVLLGSAIAHYVPIAWVKLAGGAIMLGYALFEFLRGVRVKEDLEKGEESLFRHFGRKEVYAFLGILGSLILLDLAGDATELLTVVFVAQYGDILLVFSGAVVALVAASAIETALGNRLGRLLSARRVRNLSVVVFLVIGSVIVLTSGISL